ncbi:MAG: glycosyltransferase family 4 protein [Actinomycetota bacterium]|nr:glycosyltransferase family 4 protein [Actinomycetota bacterium]
MSAAPRIVAVAPGQPLAAETFSGTSRALLLALERRGALVGAVDGRPRLLAELEKAASFSPVRERWQHRYNAGTSPLSPAVRRAMSTVSARRAAAAADDANALLQMTGWYDPASAASGMLRCSYHDGNLAQFLRRPDLRIDARSRSVRRALEYEQRLYDAVDLILCMSEGLRHSFVEDFGQDPAKVVTAGAGANLRVPERAPERDFGRPRLLFVGKQFERKGGPTLLRAFTRVRARRPDAELWIVGPTALRVSGPGVRMLGRIARVDPNGEERIAHLYEQATAFVMPSVYEPLGVALLEAMAYRLPCVGSTVGAIPELVEDGATGYVVPVGDDEALADRLLRLVEDPERARRMGEAGFERFRSRYTWDAVAGRTVDEIAERL